MWFYGSAVGRSRNHRTRSRPIAGWPGAVDIGGFLSSPGQCKANVLHGYAWRSADGLLSARADFIVVASETSRLSIQEELSRLDLLDRMIPAYGMAAAAAVYERDPDGPGQAFVAGSSAHDYATRELVARTGPVSRRARGTEIFGRRGCCSGGRLREVVTMSEDIEQVEANQIDYVAMQRHFYDERATNLTEAQVLVHPDFCLAQAQAVPTQAHALLEVIQRTYAAKAGGNVLDLMKLASTPSRDLRILDFGCGVGRLMKPLAEAGFCVDGVDISERMLSFARNEPALKQSEFFLSNGNNCGAAPAGVYDFVYSYLCFQHICSRAVRNELLAGDEARVAPWRRRADPDALLPGSDRRDGAASAHAVERRQLWRDR